MVESPPKGWLLLAFDQDQRQHAGNAGYDDEMRNCYRYDSLVANSRRLEPGDFVILRSKHEVVGCAWITNITSATGHKTLSRCPACHRTSLKRRKTKSPAFRCHKCELTFDSPENVSRTVTQFEAQFGETFVHMPGLVQLERLRQACLRYNEQLAMQEIDLTLLPEFFPSAPKGHSVNLFADVIDGEADKMAEAGEFDLHNLEDARIRVMRLLALRRGQPGFRRSLLRVYKGRCCVTGCEVQEALEACHIVEYRGDQTHHIQNGLLLRADIHSLFDQGLLSVGVDYRVVLHCRLRGTSYEKLHGISIQLPTDEVDWPNECALKLRSLPTSLP